MAVFSALAARADGHAGRAVGRLSVASRELLRGCLVLLFLISVATADSALADGQRRPVEIKECAYLKATDRSDCNCARTNFVVRSFVGGPHAGDVAKHCDEVCTRLGKEVFGLASSPRWTPKCSIVLHSTKASYLAAVGRNGAQTIGSSTISLSGGRVTQRRIDLLAVDVDKGLAALPHELVHVLFVDAFPTRVPPKWAEEGLALVMDSAEKQTRHRRDLDAAFRSRSTLPISRLLADENYPTLAQRAAFYGQSLSLVEYLMRQATPADFVRFVKLSVVRGADRALADVYQLNARELERDWRLYATSTSLAVAD
jgi:hypothetical protein